MTSESSDAEYKHALVESYLPLAVKIADTYRRRAPEWVESDEISSVAYYGLVAAADKFDPTYRPPQGDPKYDPWLAFGAFAKIKIHGAIRDWMRTQDHVPRRQRQTYKDIQQLGPGSTPESTAASLGLDVRRVRAVVYAVENNPVSLEAEYHREEDSAYIDRSSADSESSVMVNLVQEAVAVLFEQMSSEEKSVISLRYYMGYDYPRIAAEMQSSVGRVKAIFQEASWKIHHVMLQQVS